MRKSFSRLSALALSVAVLVMVSVGVFAYDEHLKSTLEGYGDYDIMPLASDITFSRTSSSMALTFSGFPYSAWNQTVTSIPTSSTQQISSFSSYPTSFVARVSGPAYSVTLSSSSGIQVNSRSTVRVSGTLRIIFDMLAGVYLSDYRYSPGTIYYPAPNGIALLFDGQEVAYQNISVAGSSTTSLSYDLLGIAEKSVSTVSLRLDYPAIDVSRTYTRNASSSYYSTYFFYDSVYRTTGRVWQWGISSQSNTYEVDEITTDYIPILTQIYNALSSISGSVSQVSPMEQFENDYLDKFGDQISQAEQAMSPSNPALPNGGDVGGFVDDISGGLGLSGSSFSSSDFFNAVSGFTGSESTGVGGPWEFFTQGVADSLSGDSPMGIDADYDPILAWFEQAEERMGFVWSNP